MSTQALLDSQFHTPDQTKIKNQPIHHKHKMSETVIQLNKNSLLGTIKKFAFNFSKKTKCQNARSNSYLFDLRKKKDGISTAVVGVVKKNQLKTPAKKLSSSLIVGQNSSPKTMYTSNASTQENLQYSQKKLKHKYTTSSQHPKKISIRKYSNNFSFQNMNHSRQVSPFTVESSEINYSENNKHSAIRYKKKQFQKLNKSIQIIRMNENSDDQIQEGFQSPKFRKHSNFSKLNSSDFDSNIKKVGSQKSLIQLNSSYYDKQFQQFEQYYQNKGLAKRKGMKTSHKFHPNHSKKKDNYYKELSKVLDKKMEHIGELIIEKKKIEKENKKIKQEIQSNYKDIDSTYCKMHQTKNLINNQLVINEEKRVSIQNVKNQIYLIRQKMKEIKQSFKDENTPKIQRALEDAQKASTERDEMLDQMMQMAQDTKSEKDVLVKQLKNAKECIIQLRQKIKYQSQVDATRKKLLIEKGNLMKELINNENFTSKTVKKQAGKESFNLAKNLKKVFSQSKLYKDQVDD